MNLLELRQQVMFQTGNDAEDLGDFQPHLTDYLNEGYTRLLQAYSGRSAGREEETALLSHDRSVPDLPEWLHRPIADYATWMVYRNGSAQKQNRGMVFLRTFSEAASRARAQAARSPYITRIPL